MKFIFVVFLETIVFHITSVLALNGIFCFDYL